MKVQVVLLIVLDILGYQFCEGLLLSAGRNTILQNICPQVYGLFTVKLAGKCKLNRRNFFWKTWCRKHLQWEGL
jgi:hypothetical protein